MARLKASTRLAVATLKAQVALVAELEGVQVSYSKRIEERVIRKSTNNEMERPGHGPPCPGFRNSLWISSERKGGRKLAIKDGKVLYVALAQPLSPANRNR